MWNSTLTSILPYLLDVNICGAVKTNTWDNGALLFDQELLKQWMVLEYETLKRERRLAIAAFNKVIALAHSVRQIVLFVDVLESQVIAIVF